jgi:hypothetical protein
VLIKFRQNWSKRKVIHKNNNFVWNTEEFPQQWKEPVVEPIEEGDKPD